MICFVRMAFSNAAKNFQSPLTAPRAQLERFAPVSLCKWQRIVKHRKTKKQYQIVQDFLNVDTKQKMYVVTKKFMWERTLVLSLKIVTYASKCSLLPRLRAAA